MRLLLTFTMLLFCQTSYANWYIIDEETNRAKAIAQYEPSKEDLESRGETAIYSKEKVDLDMAEYRNGKIKERLLTSEERNKAKELVDKKKKKEKDFESVKQKLITLGLTEDEIQALK